MLLECISLREIKREDKLDGGVIEKSSKIKDLENLPVLFHTSS